MAITLDGTTGITTTNGDVYAEGNILGTVSQTAGVPTGSILEKGSDANGEYVRYADGTQICWNYAAGNLAANDATGSLFRTAATTTWTFPVAFIAAPVVTGSTDTSVRWVSVGTATTTNAVFRHYAAITSATTIGTTLMAIGRWY